MFELAIIASTIFIAYKLIDIIGGDHSTPAASEPVETKVDAKVEASSSAEPVKKPAARKPAAKKPAATKAAATEKPVAVKAETPAKAKAPKAVAKPAAAKPAAAKASEVKKPAVKKAAAPKQPKAPAAAKPAAAAKPKATKAAAKAEEPAPVLTATPAENLKNPKTGEVVKVPATYAFAKRWVKDALVDEGLLTKVYKNNELDNEANAKIQVAMNQLRRMAKYQ